MRLARRALVAALATLALCAAASAQTLRPETDPRNLSPAVGTGGPVSGPTGLFTIYDGQTLRRGEFTFSVAYSNYDRDPGNVDIVETPLSFNIGLNDHLELFFSTNGYRGIHVNSLRNLSGAYLPNVSQYFSATLLGSAPAIVLAPNGGLAGSGAIFRPAFNQPFVPFPFVGGSAGTFQQGPGVIGGLFGFPGFTATLGATATNGNAGFFGRNFFNGADNFPGIGSVFGGILPGIVLATADMPCTALTGNCRPPGSPNPLNVITVPTTFTLAPSYLPDAPFLGRPYGESAFGNFVVGAKWRLTSPNNPLGVGIMPFYRWYPDKADDASGFNELQRGASPGGNIGDFGIIGFLDARLSRSVNISVNGGYILNSSARGKFPNGDFTMLDRPDEFLAGIAVDIPVNKHFQPVLELKSVQYVGGRTPNAFENNPVEGLAGVKIYPRRWWGFAMAYRRHFNSQDVEHINGATFNTQINQISGVFVPGRGIVIVPGTTRPATRGGLPIGFTPSDDPDGFMGQFWIGHRNARAPSILPNQPPVVTLSSSSASVTLPCPEGATSDTCTPSANSSVQLTANATDPDGDTLLYTWSAQGGKITGDGPNVTWDLTGVTPGTYTATVEVDDGCGCVAFTSTTVTVTQCTDCLTEAERQARLCPTLNVTCPDTVQEGTPITVTANTTGGNPSASLTYNWSVSAGTITSGQGTSSITVDTTGLGGQTVTATVELGGLNPACSRTASCSTTVGGVAVPRKFDEYGDIKFNDEKARLDNYAIQLQNEPGSQGYIIVYGSCNGEAQARADRAKNYLVNTRGIDAGRIVTIDGGCRSELTVQLWIVPTGATPPAADTSGAVEPCPNCTPKRTRRPARRRRARRGDDE